MSRRRPVVAVLDGSAIYDGPPFAPGSGQWARQQLVDESRPDCFLIDKMTFIRLLAEDDAEFATAVWCTIEEHGQTAIYSTK